MPAKNPTRCMAPAAPVFAAVLRLDEPAQLPHQPRGLIAKSGRPACQVTPENCDLCRSGFTREEASTGNKWPPVHMGLRRGGLL